jgi:hypothetical protein
MPVAGKEGFRTLDYFEIGNTKLYLAGICRVESGIVWTQ